MSRDAHRKIIGIKYRLPIVFAALVLVSIGILVTNAYAQISLSSGTSLNLGSSTTSTSSGVSTSGTSISVTTSLSSGGTTLSAGTSNLTSTLTQILGPSPIPVGIIPITGPSLPNPPPSSNQTAPIPPSTNFTISRTSSGLVASDSFTNSSQTKQQLQSNTNSWWIYGGDAPDEKAPYSLWRDSQGLHIGVQAPANGTYAGYYAQTPITPATLYHVKVTAPVETIPSNSNFFENGMYVQNATMDVNYVTCTSVTSKIGTQWAVVAANGSPFAATSFKPLWWTGMTPTQQLTVDCTMITNGTNYLKVLLNNVPVYESKSLNLNMSNQFITFMEPQSNYAGQLLNGTFQNYYETAGGNVTVTNAPQGAATVKIVQPTSSGSGNVIVSSPVDKSGRAVLYAENQPMPIHAYIIVYDSMGNAMASTPGAIDIFGGDVYSVTGSGLSYTASNTNPLSPPTNLTATVVSPSRINLKWDSPSTSMLVTGYKIERITGSNATWSTIQSNTGSTSTTYNDTGLSPITTYTYRVSAVYATATSLPTNTASTTTQCAVCSLKVTAQLATGEVFNGMFTFLENSTGQSVSSGFTPATFALNNGIKYFVGVSNFATYFFDHWQDGGQTADPRVISITANTTITAVFRDAALQLAPASGPAGSMVTATGTTFAPNAAIKIAFDGATLVTSPAILMTNSTGGFTATFQIPGTASTGSHTISATDGTHTHSTLFMIS